MTSQENIYVVLILQGRRGLLLELQQARERAPRPHEVFGAVQATSDRLDILINNAGIGTAGPRQTSAEGFELRFAVNYLAGFLLTLLLLALIKTSAPSRIVNV